MKKLLVKYTNDNGDSVTLYDGEVTGIEWSDGADSLRVEAKTGPRRARQAGSGNANAGVNLLEMLAGAARSRNAAAIEEKKAELQREKEEAVGEEVVVAVPDEPVPDVIEQDGIEVIQAAQT